MKNKRIFLYAGIGLTLLLAVIAGYALLTSTGSPFYQPSAEGASGHGKDEGAQVHDHAKMTMTAGAETMPGDDEEICLFSVDWDRID